MFNFKIQKQSKKSLARICEIRTSHSVISTPVFMPCATVGAVKGVSVEELKDLGFEIILSNTYHLYLRPGDEEIKKMGGVQKFINWDKSILTDSGGYQVFSLGAGYNNDYKNAQKDGSGQKKFKPAKAGDNGVTFYSHLDGSKHEFTPEKVIDIQKNLGSDIMMVLDECTEYPVTKEKARKSMEKTHSWAKKALNHKSKDLGLGQALFGIIQGSVYKDLRLESAKFISSLPFSGIAVGGVSVGEGKANMYKVIKWVAPLLPKNQPRYLMGIGEPEDIIFAVNYGFDMFDCVLPSRLGRHGTVWVTKNWQKFSKLDLRKSRFKLDKLPIMKNCGCPACKNGYTRAYLSHLLKEKEMLGMRLATLHNLYILKELTSRLQKTIYDL